MGVVTQQWISGRHLDWNVVLKVPSVLGIAGFVTEWGTVTMNIGSIDPTKEGVCLQNCVRS